MGGIPWATRRTRPDKWLVLNGTWHWTANLGIDTASVCGLPHLLSERGRDYRAVDMGDVPANHATVCPTCRAAFQKAEAQ